MELMKKMRKNKDGFTLVEIIVVLVILAILAAFTIPTMLGFVNDAKGKAYIAEAREVYVAAQSTATEFSASTGIKDGALSTALGSTAVKAEKDRAAVVTNGVAAAAPSTSDGKVSSQMAKYIGTDLTIIATTATTKGAGDSAWTVIVGDGTTATNASNPTNTSTTTAKVTSLVYEKNGYQVTIKDGNASVVKLP